MKTTTPESNVPCRGPMVYYLEEEISPPQRSPLQLPNVCRILIYPAISARAFIPVLQSSRKNNKSNNSKPVHLTASRGFVPAVRIIPPRVCPKAHAPWRE